MQVEELLNTLSDKVSNDYLKREAYMSELIGYYYSIIKDPDFDQAFDYTERSLELRKKVGNELDIGFSLLMLGSSLFYKSEIERGLEYLNQALELSKKCDNKYLMALATRSLMLIYSEKGEIDLSINYVE